MSKPAESAQNFRWISKGSGEFEGIRMLVGAEERSLEVRQSVVRVRTSCAICESVA